MKARAAMAVLAALLAIGACKNGDDAVSSDVTSRIEACRIGAGAMFGLRALSKDYSAEEADAREAATNADFPKACTAPSKRSDCCEAAKRLKARLDGHTLAACDALFFFVSQDGCPAVAPSPSTSGS